MALVIFQHIGTETPGILGEVLRDYGHRWHIIKLHNGEQVPPDFDNVSGVISLGGPMNVDQTSEYPWLDGELDFIKQAHERKVPVVGICLGAQLIAQALGGEVGAMETPEVGWGQVKLGFPGTMDPVLTGMTWNSWQFHIHGQEIKAPPAGATVLAATKACKVQAFNVGQTTYGFQYHFEWNKQQIAAVCEAEKSGLVAKGSLDQQAIAQQTEQHYDLYRQLGERMSINMATSLFPSSKTSWARLGEPVKNFSPSAS